MNLPYLLYCDIMGYNISETINKLRNYDYNGIKWVDVFPDIYISIKEILKGKTTISEYIKSLKGKKVTGSLVRDDPLPFFVEAVIIPYLMLTR